MIEYKKTITFILMVDGEDLPKELPPELIAALIRELNMSDETNGMFADSLQENISGDVVYFKFVA